MHQICLILFWNWLWRGALVLPFIGATCDIFLCFQCSRFCKIYKMLHTERWVHSLHPFLLLSHHTLEQALSDFWGLGKSYREIFLQWPSNNFPTTISTLVNQWKSFSFRKPYLFHTFQIEIETFMYNIIVQKIFYSTCISTRQCFCKSCTKYTVARPTDPDILNYQSNANFQ